VLYELDLPAMKPYLVALKEAPDLTPDTRIRAEALYATELEARLGGADAVARTLDFWTRGNNGKNDLSVDQVMIASKWPRVAQAALQATLAQFAGVSHGRFDVRLA